MHHQPSVVCMGKSRYTARHNFGLLELAHAGSLDINHTLRSNESIYIKRCVENPQEILDSVAKLLGQNAITKAPELLHVTVLQSEIASRFRPRGKVLRGLIKSFRQVAPQLSRPAVATFDRIAQYPSKDGNETLFSLAYDSNTRTELDVETKAIIKRLGEVCGYRGVFEYRHDPHITIAREAREPPEYQETLLEHPIAAHLAKASFFAQRLA